MNVGRGVLNRAQIELRGEWSYDLPPVTMDTRTLKKGGLFWALEGGRRDGHDFVFDAFENGAKIAAVSREWADCQPAEIEGKTLFVMEDTLEGLQKLACEVRGTIGAKVIGITGSLGKTTTRELIVAALSSAGKVERNPGNYNNHIGVPLTLLNLNGDEQYVVIEMGANHVGEIAALCEIARPEIGLITNIAPAHLEGFGGIEGVQRAKAEMFEYVSESGLAVVNLDDDRVVESAENNRLKVGYSLGEWPESWRQSVYTGKVIAQDEWSRPTLVVEGMTVKLDLPGIHFASGALAAYTVAMESGAEPDLALRALADVQPLPGRGRIIRLRDGIDLMDESYNASISAIENALESLAHRPGKKIAVLGDCLELGEFVEEEHRRLGRSYTLEDIDRLYLVGPNMAWTAEEADLSGRVGVERTDQEQLDELVERVIDESVPGMGILVKGSRSMGLEMVVSGLCDALSESRGNG